MGNLSLMQKVLSFMCFDQINFSCNGQLFQVVNLEKVMQQNTKLHGVNEKIIWNLG